MQVGIEVKDKEEGDLLKEGLEDASLRAFLLVTTTLKNLDDNEAVERILRATAILFDVPWPAPRR